MKDHIGSITGVVIAILALVTTILYIVNMGTLETSEGIGVAIVLILVVSVIYILGDRIKNTRKGLPAKDERLKLTNYRAGYFGFIAAIWSAVGSNLVSEIIFSHELTASQNAAVVVLVSGMVFIASYLYLAQKGN